MVNPSLKLPTETYISVIALGVSIFSLWISLRNQQSKNRLIAAEKKTFLLLKLLELKGELENVLSAITLINDNIHENSAKNRLDKLLSEIKGTVEDIDKTFSKVEQKDFLNPIDVENKMAGLYKLLDDGERVTGHAKYLLEEVKNYKEKPK